MRGYKGRLIILAVLIIILALVAFLLTRRGETRQIAGGGSFSFITSIYGFIEPHGVATDSEEELWVSNTGKSEVLIYDRDAFQKDPVDTNDEKGQPLRFFSPYGIAIDDERDKAYICDYNWLGVRVLSKEGEFLYNLPRDPKDIPIDPGTIWSPFGVATYGGKVFVTSRDSIYVFDSEGSFMERWGTKGNQIGQYDFPNGIAADPNNGNLYVTDTLNKRVVALTPDGGVRWVLGIKKSAPGSSVFQLPRGISVGPDSRIYVTDTFSHDVAVLDPDGKLLSIFGERGTADGQFSFPEGIAITSSNRMYIADRQNGRVQIWQLSEDMPRIDPQKIADFSDGLTVVGS